MGVHNKGAGEWNVIITVCVFLCSNVKVEQPGELACNILLHFSARSAARLRIWLCLQEWSLSATYSLCPNMSWPALQLCLLPHWIHFQCKATLGRKYASPYFSHQGFGSYSMYVWSKWHIVKIFQTLSSQTQLSQWQWNQTWILNIRPGHTTATTVHPFLF